MSLSRNKLVFHAQIFASKSYLMQFSCLFQPSVMVSDAKVDYQNSLSRLSRFSLEVTEQPSKRFLIGARASPMSKISDVARVANEGWPAAFNIHNSIV